MATSPKPPSRIATERKARGLTQVRLAAIVGVHPQTITAAERGALSDALGRRIAAALGVRAEDLRAPGAKS